MSLAFTLSAAVAVIATVLVVTRASAVHALLYLVVSLLAVAAVMFELGAAFAAALEVLVFAGAIVVLFVFVVILLQGPEEAERERGWLATTSFAGPAALAALLLVAMGAVVEQGEPPGTDAALTARQVSIALYGPYLIAVEAASYLLIAGVVGAYRLGGKPRRPSPEGP